VTPLAPVDMKTHEERELKLSVPPGFRLPRLAGTRITPRVLTAVYYDTPGHRLATAGVTLRRRVEGRRPRWQLKLPRGAARLEIEVGRDGRRPKADSPEHPPARLVELVTAFSRGEALAPAATLRTRRHGRRIRDQGRPIADVVLDTVQVLEGGRPVSHFRELEAELTGGDEQALSRIEERLRAAGATDGDGRPKLLRALGIEPAAPPAPDSSAPAAEHVRAMVAAQLAAIAAHDPGTRLGRDPESLHQMRVAVRRLRALLREAGPMLEPGWVDPLRAELEWLGDELGPVRDLDVFREYLAEAIGHLDPGERPAGARLLESLEADRRAARAPMLGALKSERYLRLLAALDEAATQPRTVDTGASLESLGERALRRLRRAIEDLGDAPSDEDLHAVRIKVKRARYAAELAQPIAGKPARRFIERAKDLQDLLGDHQDAVTAQARLKTLADSLGDPTVSLVAGRLLERQAARRARLLERFPKKWRKLDKRGRKLWG
jgi:CHAD domain-containing protein